MQLKSFTVLAGLAMSAFAAVALALFRVYMEGPPLWVIAVACAGVVALASWWWTGELGRGANYTQFTSAARTAMARAITVAVLVHCGWLLWTLASPDGWKGHAIRLIALALAEWVVATAWEHRLTHLLPRHNPAAVEVYQPTLVDNEQPNLRTADESMQRILIRGGWPYMLVTAIGELPDGHKGRTFEVRALTAVTASELTGQNITSVKALSVGDDEDLAVAAEEELGIDLDTRWIRIQGTNRPGRVRVTIALEDIFAKPLPYRLVEALAGPDEPYVLGPQVHGEPAILNVKQHGVICGATQSGKTALVNLLLAEHTRRDCEVFICGIEKIYDLVGQWFDCHLGTDNDLPFVAVMGIDDTLQLLAEVYYEARRRQNLPHHERATLKPWHIYIEEAPAVLNSNDRVVEIEGRKYNASALVAHLKRTITSVMMFVTELSQEFDNAMFGDSAASIKGNSGYRLIMRSQSGDERSRAFGKGGADLPDLAHPGEFYIKDNAPTYAAKSYYINEMHANKKRLHDGVDIATVSLSRSKLVAARRLGDAPLSPWMAGLPTRMTDKYRDYLQGRRSLPMGAGVQRPAIEAVDAGTLIDQEIAKLEAELAQRDRVSSQVVDNTPRPKLREFVVEALKASDTGLTTDELVAAAVKAGYKNTSKSSIENALTDLRRKQLVASSDNDQGRRVHRAT